MNGTSGKPCDMAEACGAGERGDARSKGRRKKKPAKPFPILVSWFLNSSSFQLS
jgi:hypothetical protein